MANKKRNKAIKMTPENQSVAVLEADMVAPTPAGRSKNMLKVLVPLVLIASLATFAHVKIAMIGDDYSGILSPLDRVFDLLLTFALIGVAYAVGRKVCRLWAIEFVGFAEDLSFSVMLGVGVVGLFIFGLGIFGLFKGLPVAALFIALIAFTYREIGQLWTAATQTFQSAMIKTNRPLALMFMGLIVLLAIRAAEPPHAVDEAIYHLPAPKDFVNAGRLIPLYDNFSGNLPLLPHMFYVVCLIAKADIATRLFSLSLAVISALALYAFCTRYLNKKMAVLALFGFFGAGMVTEVSITARIDVTVAGMVFIATYAMTNYLETDKRGWLVVSALLAGFSLGVKYTAGVWIAMIGVMYLYECLFKKRQPVMKVLTNGIIFVAIAFAGICPWLVKNYAFFKNPVYPFMTGEVAEYNGSDIRYFNADDEQKMEAFYAQARKEIPQENAEIEQDMAYRATLKPERHPFRVWEYYTQPDTYNMGEEPYHNPNYLFLVVPLLLILPKQRWVGWMAIFSLGFYLFVASTAWIARYYLPLYPALTLISVYVLTTLSERLKKYAPIASILPTVAVATAVVLTAFVFAVQIYKAGGISYLSGSLSRREFLQAVFYHPIIDHINRNTLPTDKVMLVGAQMGYHLERDYLADAGWDTVEWQRLMVRNNSFEQINDELKRRGITHILFITGLFRFVALMGREGSGPSGAMYKAAFSSQGRLDYYVQLRNWVTFECYRKKFTETVASDGDYFILKIK
jgi:hypothetical protein